MINRRGCVAIILAATTLAGCDTAALHSCGGSRLLTGTEMDQISAGSATATANATAVAVGTAPQTTTATSTLASSGTPIPAPPFLSLLTPNYASSKAEAAASRAPLTVADGSVGIAVDGGSRGARIDVATTARSSGNQSSQAQIDMQFYGLSVGQVDLVFGTATATACCAPSLAAQTIADWSGAGYWSVIQASPRSLVPGQLQSRIDISVVASSLPVLDAGQVSALIGPASLQSMGQ